MQFVSNIFTAGTGDLWYVWNHGPLVMAAYLIGQAIIFLPCGFYLLLLLPSFSPRLTSAATDWISTILLHMAWP